MLRKEQAKLQDGDMKKTHIRAKRLETRKKHEILRNEFKQADKIREIREKKEKLINFRLENKIKYNSEK